MPNIKSAKKRVLVSEKKNGENTVRKSVLKTSIKKFESAVKGNDKSVATDALKAAVKKIDQAVAKNIIHKNKAANKKSQLATKLNTMG